MIVLFYPTMATPKEKVSEDLQKWIKKGEWN